MRRYLLIVGLIALFASPCFALTWEALYSSRLEDSSSYLEAKIDLKSAQADFDTYAKPFTPVISITTNSVSNSSYNSGISFGSETSSGGTLIPTVTFEKALADMDISLQAPITFSTSSAIGLGNPSISLSRSLFPETRASRLDAEASLISAQASIQKIKDDLTISLASDILDAVYYQRLLKTGQKNLAILKKVRESTVDTTKFNELDKSILNAQKSILVATNSLAKLKSDVKDNAETLYEELSRLRAEWLASARGAEPNTSKSIRAIELSLGAAELRGKSAIFAYLPNPSLSGSLYYDIDKKKAGWDLSIKLSYYAMNKGKNNLDAMKREEYPKIYKIKLQSAKDELRDTIQAIRDELEKLDLDQRIKTIEITDAMENASKLENLYKSGFASQEDFMTAQINVETLQLDSQKIDSDIFIQKLRLEKLYEEAE